MPKYRKKMPILEAQQFLGFYSTPHPPGVEFEDNSNDAIKERDYGRYAFFIRRSFGRVYIKEGDYIVKYDGLNDYYKVDADRWEREYEEVAEGQ